MKLTTERKKLLIWTAIMSPTIGVTAALIAFKYLNELWGGLIFIFLMLIIFYGNYLIIQNEQKKKAKHGL